MAVFFAEATERERILITEPIARVGVDLLRRELPQARIDERFGLATAQLRALIGEYSVLIVRSETRVTDELLAAAPRLKVIGRAGSGIDNIDLDAAFRRRVLVVHAPRGNIVAVAEHTMALLLALLRHLPAANASLKAGRWEKRRLVGVELANKTLGILGLGKIGREVALRAQAFAMQVLAADPVVSAEQARRVGVTLLGKEEVLRQADVVTLHAAPAGDMHAMRPILGARELALLKPGAYLVNCARGGLLDEAALLEALEQGRLAGAALDVFSQEPIGDNARLTAAARARARAGDAAPGSLDQRGADAGGARGCQARHLGAARGYAGRRAPAFVPAHPTRLAISLTQDHCQRGSMTIPISNML